MPIKVIALTALIGFLSIPSWAQTDVAGAQTHLREAGQAYRDGDFAAFASSLETARNLNPFSLATSYNLACAYARTDRHDEALGLLGELVDARVDYGMANDPDLEVLHARSEFSALLTRLEENLEPISNSSHHYTIEQLGIVPEGIAIDTETSRTFLGSMRSGDIFVIDADGQMAKFATVAHDGTLAAIGLYVDDLNQTLWAVGSSFGLNENFDAEAPARAGVFGFDLASGQPTEKFIAADADDGFNDVIIGSSGDMYISGGVLSVVRSGSGKIEPMHTSLPIFGSNGLALSPDGTHLFVTSYPVGIAVVDVESGDTTWLAAPDSVTLYGIDGLYWYEGDLVGVQNGVRPWRLTRMTLREDMQAVTSVRLIEFANASITPTTGAIVDDQIYYVGEGPAPEQMPAHFPPNMARNAGKTIVMTAPLN